MTIISNKYLLSLPQRKWDTKKIYDFLYFVPTKTKHDSGYGIIAIIGACYGEKTIPGVTSLINFEVGKYKLSVIEIAAYCDDISWYMPESLPSKQSANLRMDCEYPSGIIRAWHYEFAFEVGVSLSSTDIRLVVR